MNGMNSMFNNNNSIPPQTPSPMSAVTPRYMQPHSNTITLHGSNTGGSVQMADMGIGMNGFAGMPGPPPITSTPNSMMPFGGPSPQMNNNNNAFLPPPPPYNQIMLNGYNSNQSGRMPSSDNLLLNPFEPLPITTPELTGLQMFEKIQKSVGFIFVALLRDSILDLHYDAVYDSCPLCSCTESIRTNEFGIYLSIPPDVQVADNVHSDERTAEITVTTRFGGFFVKNRDIEGCFCAFSAVRHRILCYANSNLFTDDIREATGGPVVVEVEKPELKWFNPLKSADWKFIDIFRWYLLGHDLSAYIRTGNYIGDPPMLDKIEEFDRLVSPKKEYIINGIDQGELDYIVSSVLDASAINQMMAERTSRKNLAGDLTSLIHPWAVQMAEKTCQLNEIEYGGFMPKIVGILEDTAQMIRSSTTTQGNIVEGPLTWKSLHQKATKMYKIQKSDAEEDTAHNPEPIPNIVVGSEKDLILTSPTAIWAWDRYLLAPYSWPKNILYLAVIPDHSFATDKTKSFAENSLITEKCKIFLEDLSSVYEKNRLGRHLPLPPKVKDSTLNNGIIKIPLQNLNNSNDQKSLTQKLDYFVTQYLQLISRIFGEMDCFDKRTFLEAVYRDFYADHHSSAVPTDSSTMPPPAAIPQQQHQQQQQSTSSPMPPTDPSTSSSFDSSLFNHQQQISTPQPLQQHQQQQQQNINSPLPNMGGLFDGSNPRTPDPAAPLGTFGNGIEDPLSLTSISNGVDELMINDEENQALPHVLVIYIVNPFFFGSANTQEYFSKLVTVKLLKSFNNILSNLDHIKRPRVQVELIDIRTIFDYSAFSNDPLQEYFHPLNQSTVNDPMASINALRKLAFTVYSQPRQLHVEGIRDSLSKSMTRFGPFSQATDILDTLAANPSSTYRIPTAPFILAPKSSNYEITPQGKLKLKNSDEKVLFVTYCLVKDDFLIVSVTDDRGELNDTKVISISRRTNQKSAQKNISSQVSLVVDAIQRLWAYIQGVMSLDTKNWRLVIGRFGKIGHGEFKAWTSILAKKNLQQYNSILKGKDKELQTPAADKPSILTASTSCKTCSLNPGFIETPALIAACLVSTEADAYFKVFPELLADSKQRNGGRIIPNDYSITHIMVFPTSPCISNEIDTGLAEDKEDDFAFFEPDVNDNAGMEIEGIDIDINDLGEVSSATTTIANQPIAMGFMISTAPALDAPEWFFSQCPNAKNDTPVHLRSALHISVPHVQQSDEVMLAMAENHPLESNKTEEVLT
uniref:Mediator of RNA polymerase II transcription subunit 13 n=1 Tax=Panagrolaimus superbus TaxID=310955 RepID=A0A914ZAK8_9BILA